MLRRNTEESTERITTYGVSLQAVGCARKKNENRNQKPYHNTHRPGTAIHKVMVVAALALQRDDESVDLPSLGP